MSLTDSFGEKIVNIIARVVKLTKNKTRGKFQCPVQIALGLPSFLEVR